MNNAHTGSAKVITLVTILVVCIVLAAAIFLLPKGFRDDVSVIGQGTAVVVLTHDKNLVGGAAAMALLNRVRSDYETRVEFLAVDVNTASGRAFLQQQKLDVLDLVFFDAGGTRRDMVDARIGEQTLRTMLDKILIP